MSIDDIPRQLQRYVIGVSGPFRRFLCKVARVVVSYRDHHQWWDDRLCSHMWHFSFLYLSFLPIIRCFSTYDRRRCIFWHTPIYIWYRYYWLVLLHMLWDVFKFTCMIIAHVYLTLEKQLHLLMYLKILEYADIQYNQIHIPRDALSKIILIKLDF